jgi:RNA polymerase sigma factor (sigma-70 family)
LSFSALSDEELLVAIQAGDIAARELLEERFGRDLLRVAQRRCHALCISVDLDEDIVQEVYARVLDPKTTPFDPTRRSARSYLAGLAFNAAKGWMLSYRGRIELTPEAGDNDRQKELLDARSGQEIEKIVTHDLFVAILKGESTRLQRVVMAHYLADTDLQILAREEGISTFKMSRELRGFYDRTALLRHVFAA